MPDVSAASDGEGNGAASDAVEASETIASGSVLPELVETIAVVVKVAVDKAAGAAETADAVADIAKCVSIVGVCSRRLQLLRDAFACSPRLLTRVGVFQDCTRSSLVC